MQKEWVDKQFLASSRVNTPDPRQKCPFEGQRLLIGWDFPKSLFSEELTLDIVVRLWDQTEKKISYPITHKRDATAFFFPCGPTDKNHQILTYRIQVINRDGVIVETWNHHFWTELINLGDS